MSRRRAPGAGRNFSRALVGLLAVCSVGSCGKTEGPSRGGLLLVLSSDGSTPIGRLDVAVKSSNNKVLLSNTYRLPSEAQLPTTLAIVSDGNETAQVEIAITGWKRVDGKADVPIDHRDAIVTQVPADRVATLNVVLSANCAGTVKLDAKGNALSTCAASTTCDGSGNCVSSTIAAGKLSTFKSGDEKGGAVANDSFAVLNGGGGEGGEGGEGTNNAAGGQIGGGGKAGASATGTSGAASNGASCGNGQVESSERCDDGNAAADDGCSASCRIESGWNCDQGEPTHCTSICGDGLVVGDEAKAGGCDDHNGVQGDGCSGACLVEAGYVCSAAPSVCAKTCGDGKLDAGETCDDKNAAAGDGCFACAVETGFTCDDSQVPSKCADAVNCANGMNNCDANATCTETPGSFACACKAGFVGNGLTCADAINCANGMNNCSANATCSETPGSFNCACKTGFTGNGVTCVDAVNCTNGMNNCSANATCSETPGSFSCACTAGYAGNGVTCTDVNECTNGTNNCSANAACTNTAGAFTCACKAGYTGTGVTCERTSCAGLAANCGLSANDDCCGFPTVTGGNFTLGGATGTTAATVATFALDKYEVSVGRFRKFVATYTGPPASGAGANPLIAGSGWQAAWNASIAANSAALATAVSCTFQTWNASGANDRLPMNCVSWYEAFAFCAWDGGRMPTEAEWEYAAGGGSEQRKYPWGNSPVPTDALDSTAAYANYDGFGDGASGVTYSDILVVGSKPAGLSKYGQLDLAGSMEEWVLDRYASYPSTCNNCANLSTGGYRVGRGGDWTHAASYLAAAQRSLESDGHYNWLGFRCSRVP